MKKFVVAAMAAALAVAPASADRGCNGCNVVDSGVFGRGMVGYTVYLENSVGSYTPVSVLDVDVYSNKILWESRSGRVWSSARNFYTETSANERMGNAVGAAAGAVGAVVLICMFSPESCSNK